MVCDKDLCERWYVTKMVCERCYVTKRCDKDSVCERWCVTKEEAEEEDWDGEPGGTDLKARAPHKDVGNNIKHKNPSAKIAAKKDGKHSQVWP